MSRLTSPLLCLLAGLSLGACGNPNGESDLQRLDREISRDTAPTGTQLTPDNVIKIVGSSTVAPFSATVAEQFAATSKAPAPVIETTGTGGGFLAFCKGLGPDRPSVVNASRPIKPSEQALCKANGVTELLDVQIGYDGIAIVNSKLGPRLGLSREHLYLALAATVPDGTGGQQKNPHQYWSDIAPGLPAQRILVSGPPPTSGTRDTFIDLVMVPGAVARPDLASLRENSPDAFMSLASTIRTDGVWVNSGENDAAIVRTLLKNREAIGVLGFSFLNQNRDRLQAAAIDGVAPNVESISNGDYAISRSLFFYVKTQNLESIPELGGYINAFTSEDAWGPTGYLTEKGLIPLSDEMRTSIRAEIVSITGGDRLPN